ncbi:MAG: cysteine dioxygenase family protein [Planctomycetes bacterium]|nr:cysteine dioxygenase family protein [Planctomycetota bacterium]
MDCMSLNEYVAAVTALVSKPVTPTELVSRIKPLKERLLAQPELIPATFHEGLDRVAYTRNLLYADPAERFTVMAIVWGAGKGTPVHDHATWGVVGCYGETVSVVNYDPADEHGVLRPHAKSTLPSGQVVTVTPPRLENIHQMMNECDRPAISIHTYGDPARLCRVYDPKTGRHNDCELSFHHGL